MLWNRPKLENPGGPQNGGRVLILASVDHYNGQKPKFFFLVLICKYSSKGLAEMWLAAGQSKYFHRNNGILPDSPVLDCSREQLLHSTGVDDDRIDEKINLFILSFISKSWNRNKINSHVFSLKINFLKPIKYISEWKWKILYINDLLLLLGTEVTKSLK